MRLRFDGEEFVLEGGRSGLKRRDYSAECGESFAALASRYDGMVRADAYEGLLELGREIRSWLDGAAAHWLAPFRDGSGPR